MAPSRMLLDKPPMLGLTLSVALAVTLLMTSRIQAQPMSSGSGVGTGTGMSGGAARNTTGVGQESGPGNSTGTGNESGAGPGRLPSNRLMLPGRGNDNAGPGAVGPGGASGPRRSSSGLGVETGAGIGTNFPDDATMMPFDALLNEGAGNVNGVSTVTDRHLLFARAIKAPGDRSMALSRVASAATFSNQLELADKALAESANAAFLMPGGLVRDQRLMSIVTGLMNLAEAYLREGRNDATLPDLNSDENSSPSAIPKPDRNTLIRRAQADWKRAGDLAQQLGSLTYKNEIMYRVADSIAFGSQSIVNEYSKTEDGSSLASNKDASGLNRSFDGLADRLLLDAAALASRIERPVWHDRGLVAVATAAAESGQFARALTIARQIPQPEVRTNALLKIAELQARRKDPAGATATYQEAAVAVASIPLEDPRAVLTGVLIDNLISVGRFDDARASVSLYPDQPRRMIALNAIAHSQGARGLAASALDWINRDVPPQYRSQLFRSVNNGVVSAIEINRSRVLSGNAEK